MTKTRSNRRKKEIKKSMERSDLNRKMMIGLAFDTEDGRKYQSKIGEKQ